MHFGITEKLTTDCVSLYNSAAGLISKVSEKIASEKAENRHSRQPHCRLMPLHQGTSANSRIPYTAETRVIGHLAYISATNGSVFI